SPGPDVSLAIEPPLTIDKLPAVSVTLPALLVLPALAREKIPVTNLGSAPVPSMTRPPATRTATLPALPGPNVLLLEISPLLTMVKVPALTITSPAFPAFPGPCWIVFDEMPVKPLADDPAIVK